MTQRQPVEQAHGGVVETVGRADFAVLGAAHVHGRPHFTGQNLTQLHTPLVE